MTDEEIGKLREYVRGEISKAQHRAWVLERAGV